jgi:Na+/H+-dicarboxylate symporter
VVLWCCGVVGVVVPVVLWCCGAVVLCCRLYDDEWDTLVAAFVGGAHAEILPYTML